jgi:hypothetical protein
MGSLPAVGFHLHTKNDDIARVAGLDLGSICILKNADPAGWIVYPRNICKNFGWVVGLMCIATLCVRPDICAGGSICIPKMIILLG